MAAAAEVTGAGAALGAGESKATQVVDAGGATGAGRPLAALVVVGGGAGAFSSTVSLATKRFVSKTFSTNLLIALSFLGIAKGEEERATRQLQRHGRADNSRETGRAARPASRARDLRRAREPRHTYPSSGFWICSLVHECSQYFFASPFPRCCSALTSSGAKDA